MVRKYGTLCAVTMVVGLTYAMPTAKEIEKVSPIVENLMKADVTKLKQGKCMPSDVGESAVALAKAADTQAAKYYLLTSAVPYFAKDGKYDRIVATLDDIKTTVPDVPVRELVQLVEQTLVRAPKTDVSANRLRKMVDDFRVKEKSEAQAEKMRQAIARNPSDRSLHTKLAEHMAVMDNWEIALSEFAQGDNKDAARTAKVEKAVGGVANVGEVADAWWDYADGKTKSINMAIRKHAIDLYRAGIAENKITGLAKVQAERRIAEFASVSSDKVPEASVVQTVERNPQAVTKGMREFALGTGVKVAFQSCASGSFTMGWPEEELKKNPDAERLYRRHEVKFSSDFWMMETLVSERIWAEVMGEKAEGDNPKAVTYEELEKFIEKLRAKIGTKIPSGCVVRLPTYAEYEYALISGGAERGTPFAQLRVNGDSIRQAVDEAVTKPKANKWNLRGLRMNGGHVWLADIIGFDKSEMSPTGYRWDAQGMRINRINWPKSSVDPLIPLGGGWSQHHVFLRDTDILQPYGASDGKVKAFFRLVLAPKVKEDKK